MVPTLKRAAAIIALLAALTLFGAGSSALAQSSSETLVRFVHAIPGASAVDIYTDGTLTVGGLEFGEASLHLRLPAGDHQLSVTQAGVETVLWQQNISLAAGTAQTFIASSTNPLGFQPFTDDLSPLPFGKTRFTAIHAIAGGPSVDVLLSDGRPVIAGLNYNQPYGTFDLQTAGYELVVVPGGESLDSALIPASSYALNSNGVYTLLIYGTAANPQATLLFASALPEPDSGFVRVVHGVPGAPPVDVYVDEALVAPALSFGANATDYLPLAVGAHTVGARPVGGERNVVEIPLQVDANQRTSVAILRGEGGSGLLLPLTETPPPDASPDAALFNVINVLPSESSATVTAADGSVLAEGIVSGALTTIALDPADGVPTLSVTAGEAATESQLPFSSLYGGVYYAALIVQGENGVEVVALDPTGFGQGVVTSATIAARPTESAVVEQPTEASAVVEPMSTEEPTAAPTEVAQAQPTAAPPTAVEPTVAPPTEVPAPTEPPGTSDPTANLPRARVLLDPGVNLQLRQRPDRNALSLGLIATGEILIVNGRTAGAIDQVAPIEVSGGDDNAIFGSQATEAPVIAPLSNEIWLFVTYNTPDGGTIDAWVLSEYVDVRTLANAPVKIADLPIIPSTILGEARNTAITPPPVRQSTGITLIVGNMNEGVNLNIRRTPSADGEVLVQVPKGTELQYIGVNSNGQWVLVRYEPPQVNSITGWVNAQFIETIIYEGKSITEAEMAEKELIVIIPDSERGGVGLGIPGVEVPTVDSLRNAIIGQVYSLNPGVNLQFRRGPDTLAESLALLPNGTQLLVNGRSADGSWLQVTYEGQDGWVSSKYVQLTFNGRDYQLEEVPLFEGQPTQPVGVNLLGATQLAPDAAPQIVLPTPTPARAMVVTRFVNMTDEPGGSSEGLPALGAGQEVFYLGGDPNSGYVWIQTPDGVSGWVQSDAVQFK